MAEDISTLGCSQGEGLDRASAERLKRLEATFNGLPMLIAYIGHDHRYRFNNRAYEDWVGIAQEQLAGMHMREVLGEELYGEVRPFIDSALAGTRKTFERQVTLPTGESRFVHVDYVPDRLEDDSVAGAFALIQDFTDRRAAEDAAEENQIRFRSMFERAGVGMVEIDSDWRIIAANRAYCAITGREPDELIGESCLSFTLAEDIERSEQALRAITGPGPDHATFEKRYFRKNGSIVWVRSNLARIGSDGGGRFLKIVEDISDTKHAELAVKEAQRKLREESHNLETLNQVGSALAAQLDLEKLVQMVTDAGVELTGAKFGAFFYNVVNANGEALMLYTLSGADRSQFERFGMPRNTKVFAPTFAGEGVVRSEDITKDPRYGHNPPHQGMPKGHLPVKSYLAVPVTGRSGEVIGALFFGHPKPGMFTDRHEHLMTGIAAQAAVAIDNARLFREAQAEIERRVAAEQALTGLNETLESRVSEEIERRLQAEEALRQAQKIETVGQLSGGIAHDFNNLLQIIHGNLTLLQRELPSDRPKLSRSVANAINGTERAASLTRRLLAFSRRQSLDPRPVDVNRMIGDMTDLLHRTLGETIRIDAKLAFDTPRALVDCNQLENAILNLAINARDSMPGGGTVEIETGTASLDERYAQLHPHVEPGSYVKIVVRDHGQGMAPEVLERAVEPFFTTKEVGHGTGLGLSMVYGFLKQSGGHLELHSTEGEGTSVEMFLPRSGAEAEARSAGERRRELKRGQGERILVCEDDGDVRTFSSETLRDLGYAITEAGSAAEAIELLRQSQFDLLFTDIILPGGKTGADLAREARSIQPRLKLLFTTGYARSALDNPPEPDETIELLAKPFSVDELAARLRKILDT